MPQNYDDIQAQLAAYIDGALPPEQHAEIEKHLAANPSHQAMLGELMTHKRVLRALPRVKAPADLSEELLTQLEREQLLGEPVLGEHRPLILRLFGGAGLAAAAALLLMIGLVVAVYKILPGRPPIAVVAPARDESGPKAPAAGSNEVVPSNISEIRKSGVVVDAAPPAPVAAKALASDATVMLRAGESEKLSLTPSAQSIEQLTLAVTAPDVDQANGEVLKFLTDNNIAWAVGTDADAGGFRNLNYPRVAALTESARIREYSRAIAEEDKVSEPARPTPSPADGGLARGGGAGRGGGGGGFGGAMTGGSFAAKGPAHADDPASQAALAPSNPRENPGGAPAMGTRQSQNGAIAAAIALQKDVVDAKAKDGRFEGYTNALADANNRTILARRLNAAQVEHLAMVLERPAEGLASIVVREASDNPAGSVLRGRQDRYAAPAERASDSKLLTDELAKADQDKTKGAVDGLAAKQELVARSALRPAAKPAALGAPATQPERRAQSDWLDDAVRSKRQIDPAQQSFQMFAERPTTRPAVQGVQALADHPTTRPADQELYDVLIVLSSAPVPSAAVNAPPAAAASPVPATAPASRPVPDAKRE
ncbi:MAG: anti-sigma factor family protein [Tepidisphaerales bacterium]